MKNLSLGARVILGLSVFAIPFVILTGLLFKSESVNIEFGRKEKLGNQMQTSYESLLKTVSLLNIKTTLKETDLIADEGALLADLNTNLLELDTLHKEIGSELKFTPEELTSRKRENADLSFLRARISEKKWDDAFVSIKAAIAHLGDTSNLILDPDLDSYYLMDITLLAAPQLQERINKIMSSKGQFFQEPELSASTRNLAALHASMLEEADLSRIIGDSQTSLNEDGNFFGTSDSLQKNLPTAVTALKEKGDKLILLLRKIANAEKVDEREFSKTGLDFLSQAFVTESVGIAELNRLLDNRISSLVWHRTVSVSVCIAIFIGAILFFYLKLWSSLRYIMSSVLSLKEMSISSLKAGDSLFQAAQRVSNSTSKQAAALEETSASVEEINTMIKGNYSNSSKASDVAQAANSFAAEGDREIKFMLNSMEEIANSSKKIVETMGVIDDIAFQTNLLALNASVEAARAGEQGRGFAVVAEAVRSLAQKCAVAAQEINKLVNENVVVIENGKRGASNSAVSLKKIVEATSNLTTLNNEISAATSEQSSGINQITKAVQEIDSETQSNQSEMSAVSELAESILTQARTLDQVIHIVEKEVMGASGTLLKNENEKLIKKGAA